MRDDPVSQQDWNRIASKLWGEEVLDDSGVFYATSSDEELAILRERVRELGHRPPVSRIQQAQLELIRGPIKMKNRQGKVVERDLSLPYYWAAFQIIGDWQ